MIEDGKNGIIVKREVEDIYRGIKALLDDKDLRKKLADEPALGLAGNQQIIKAIEEKFEKKC